MRLKTYDLVQGFVDDCRDNLDSIESVLMDIESADEHQQHELVNTVFRLAHSIKGGAGMLGLDNIKALAHKLENTLHMVRSREIVPTHEVVDVLLKGFDRLTALVDNIADSENMPIDAQVGQLLALSGQRTGAGDAGTGPARFAVGPTSFLEVDAVSLEQARSGGNELYLLEFDLMHDIHGKGRMPLDVLKSLTDMGRIVDCKVDLAAVGDLEAFGNSIPFYVLYASLLERSFISDLVKLPDERVRHIATAPHAAGAAQADGENVASGRGGELFGALELRLEGQTGTIVLPEEITSQTLEHLRGALLAGLARCSAVELDWSAVSRCDVFFYQLVLAARNTYARNGKRMSASGSLADDLRTACAVQGFSPVDDAGCLLPAA